MTHPLRARLLLLSAGLVLGLLLVEGILRWVPVRGYFVWAPEQRQVFEPRAEIMPGVSGKSRFITNAQGMRGRSLSTADRFRILTVGGSTTECLYLDQTESWPWLLQESLSSRWEGDPVWVGNVGRSGHHSGHHVLQIEKLLDRTPSIDLVVSMVGVNDLLRVLVKRDGKGTHEVGAAQSERALLDQAFAVHPGAASESRFYERTEIWQRLRNLRRRLAPDHDEEMVQDMDGSVYERWRRLRREAPRIRHALPDLSSALGEYAVNLERIVDRAQERDTRIVLVTQPSLWRGDLSPALEGLLWMGVVELGREYYSAAALEEALDRYNATLLEVCGRRGIPCVDLASVLPKDETVFYDDVHFNESGARQVARVLTKDLLARGLVEIH